MQVSAVEIKNILTRTSGYLKTVTSHSLQPYRGCTLGRSLCGAGCYVQHNRWLTRGRPWGTFLEARINAAESYQGSYRREKAWARSCRGRFSVFLSSSTEPFLPQERRWGITRGLLEAMAESPPDELVLQTHSHRALDYLGLIQNLAGCCRLRLHVSIETDRERIEGLPPHASSVQARFEAARQFKLAGVRTVITVSPLLPIAEPEAFFGRIADCAHAAVIDHFVEGDGTPDGRRTKGTPLPAAMEAIDPTSLELSYRNSMLLIARRHLPGRVGLSIDGFAGRYLPASTKSLNQVH